jgi:hypothetical protein
MRNRLGSLFAAALGTLTLALTLSAFAQENEKPKDASAETPLADAPAPEDAAAPEDARAREDATPAPPEPKAATGEATADAQASASHGGSAEVSPGGAAAEQGSKAQAEAAAAAPEAVSAAEGPRVTLEVVPASGYPSRPIRGIRGGSLALTMHGMQWPYLPAEGKQDTVRVGVSGFVWNDLSYARIESGLVETYPNQKRLITQTRGVLRISPTFSTTDGWFAQGQWEAVGHGDMLVRNTNLASTDDLYVRVGKWNLFDITAGRFQAWEIANHYGMALDINTLERDGAAIENQAAKPVPAYGLTYFWDRTDGRLGHYAVHAYPAEFLRFEMLAELGAGTVGAVRQTNFRPSGILDLGFLKVKGGVEYGTAVPQDDGGRRRIYKNGFGGAVQFVFAPWVEGGVGFAQGYEDLIDIQGVKDVLGSNTVTGYGGFLNGRPLDPLPLVIGVGVLRSHWESLSRNATPGPHYGDHNTNDQQQEFVAVQYALWEQFIVKLVGAHAKFDFYESTSTPFTNELWGLRLRTQVFF